MVRFTCVATAAWLLAGCASGTADGGFAAPAPAAKIPADTLAGHGGTGSGSTTLFSERDPEYPPRAALLAGLMPLVSIGVPAFSARYPEYDGRGVVIGILDTGIDPGLPGFASTTTGAPKILDLRDFSGEGRIALAPIAAGADGTFLVGADTLAGAGRLMGLATGPYYGGHFDEIPLGVLPASDVNGDGDNDDSFPVVVARAPDGWVLMADTDGDGSLNGEVAIRDYAVATQTFAFTAPGVPRGPLTLAANFSETDGVPDLVFFFDNQGHGSHVAGIAAGHDMFGVPGFDGVAPGAQIIGLKISNNGRGAVTVTGSVLRAMNYAADYAEERGLPLVLNLSFGIGNVHEGSAVIDSIVNEFALKHPDVLFVSSSGNDGPGISTLSVPASADLALAVCALYPAAFIQSVAFGDEPADVLAWWSARGAETAKPDLCAPGLAFSNVPRWQAGQEISPGTSMASPQIAGAAARLRSAMAGHGLHVRAIDLKLALAASATPVPHATALDQGRGVPDLTEALRWLLAGHQVGAYLIRTADSTGEGSAPAAYHRDGLPVPGDRQDFVVKSLNGQPAARLLLRSDAPWLAAPESLEFAGTPVRVSVSYAAEQLVAPGLYVGTVWAFAASDTLAGPLFGLRNTIVVPFDLDRELRFEGEVMRGEFNRYFVRVPDGVRGLFLKLELADWTRSATVHVFEPSGQPFRNGSAISAAGGQTRVKLALAGEELEAGVYEFVVTTSEGLPVEYEVTAAVPQLSIALLENPARALVATDGDAPVVARLSARILGSRVEGEIRGEENTTQGFAFRVPGWARFLNVDLRLETGLWSTLSDLGVAIVSEDGHILFAESIDYAMQRVAVPVPPEWNGANVHIELTPGFAHLGANEEWSARVILSSLFAEPVEVPLVGLDEDGKIRLAPGEPAGVMFGPWDRGVDFPVGSVPLVELWAEPLSGVPTLARGAMHLPQPPATTGEGN